MSWISSPQRSVAKIARRCAASPSPLVAFSPSFKLASITSSTSVRAFSTGEAFPKDAKALKVYGSAENDEEKEGTAGEDDEARYFRYQFDTRSRKVLETMTSKPEVGVHVKSMDLNLRYLESTTRDCDGAFFEPQGPRAERAGMGSLG